jgi:protein-S-isoprenylcysteine O-methyltransferase Ste14
MRSAAVAQARVRVRLWLASIPGFYLVIVLGERELEDRFGDAYRKYLRRVPRLVPRFGGTRRTADPE